METKEGVHRDDQKSREAGAAEAEATAGISPRSFRREAVQMLSWTATLAASVAERLGLAQEPICSTVGSGNSLNVPARSPLRLSARVHELEIRSCTASSRERDILKKALAIFGRQE